jgi:hypothetical protein
MALDQATRCGTWVLANLKADGVNETGDGTAVADGAVKAAGIVETGGWVCGVVDLARENWGWHDS